jgi:scyllo-inositol 2-dehydrogenase (NADP+)
MKRVAAIGLGKMGLSHLAIFRAHPNVELVAACDGLSYLTGVLEKYAGLRCYNDYRRMLDKETLDAVVIATPSSSHAAIVRAALDRGLDVFCEKPFVLEPSEGEDLVSLAAAGRRVTQVGYHYRFVGSFQEARRLVRAGALGRIHHVRVEARGPVVLRPTAATWRSKPTEGGGVVYDYACHAIDLVHYLVDRIESVDGVVLNSVFSKDVHDEVYCSFRVGQGVSGQLSVNWSDASCRKMTTKVSLWGENGTIEADRQECIAFLRDAREEAGLASGWRTHNTTELTDPVAYYLRGEEYSSQVDHFVQRMHDPTIPAVTDFSSALQTDRVVAMIYDRTTPASQDVEERSSMGRFRLFPSFGGR